MATTTTTAWPTVGETARLIEEVDGDLEASFAHLPEPFAALDAASCAALVQHLDECFAASKQSHVDADESIGGDLKITLPSTDSLSKLIGAAAVDALASRFPIVGEATEVKLRRCSAIGQCINFHTDHSLRTMQVPLTDDGDYDGGRLVYATKEGLVTPRRPAGSATTHDNRIVHGVTTLTRGVRYGLFFLVLPTTATTAQPQPQQ